jgi:uncharacterized protein
MMKSEKYNRYSLVLMVTHECNLCCSYCYSGHKESRVMKPDIAFKAVERGINSVIDGGILELSFFGGEPLLEVDLLDDIIKYAEKLIVPKRISLKISLTTNGTILNKRVKELINHPALTLSVSCDGAPSVHNLNRYNAARCGSASLVYEMIEYLQSIGKEFTVVSVVTPNNVRHLPGTLLFLNEKRVKFIELSLDLWSRWSDDDILSLELSIKECVKFWWENIPELGITWFDEKLLQLSGNYKRDRCRFGNGDIAVSTVGNTYPCERLIGDDLPSNPMIIEDGIWNDNDFLSTYASPERSSESCSVCTMNSLCSTDCRCSNYIRTGEVNKPDKLLCIKEQISLTEILNLYTRKEVDYVKQ